MKKLAVFATIAIVAASGIFAQAKSAERPARPEIKLPEEKVVNDYHASQMSALKALKDAQVKAGICNQEQADAAIAVLKAKQSECKGLCIVQKRTDIPFGGMGRAPQGKHCRRPMAMRNGHKGVPGNPDINRKERKSVAPKEN